MKKKSHYVLFPGPTVSRYHPHPHSPYSLPLPFRMSVDDFKKKVVVFKLINCKEEVVAKILFSILANNLIF